MLDNHEKIVLQFSGGKDSLACLYWLRPVWDKTIVLWLNTGDAHPETKAQMDEVRDLVPHFLEVMSDQPLQIEACGVPSDIVPVWNTPLGRQVRPGQRYKIQTPFACCHDNIWLPMDKASRATGATCIVRGQRQEEKVRSPVPSGTWIDGVEHVFPLEDWTRQDVLNFLEENHVPLPFHYRHFDSSLDCQHCTAYAFEGLGRMEFLKEYHPGVHREVSRRYYNILREVRAGTDQMFSALE